MVAGGRIAAAGMAVVGPPLIGMSHSRHCGAFLLVGDAYQLTTRKVVTDKLSLSLRWTKLAFVGAFLNRVVYFFKLPLKGKVSTQECILHLIFTCAQVDPTHRGDVGTKPTHLPKCIARMGMRTTETIHLPQ